MSEPNDVLVQTTCKCRENVNNIVVTRKYYDERLQAKIDEGKQQRLHEILELLETHKNLWFSQSLNIGSGAFWANKASTTQALITEIRKLNV